MKNSETTSSQLKTMLKHYRISETEYQKICELLGKPPQGVEWALFSALWSEHCSYKSSKVHLKKFAKTLNNTVVTGEGENAGVVDLGKGERIVFKMESHNHPSFIEPFQGAATGVGGILRDIFTMGARPISLADYLCFGSHDAPRMKHLINGVVRGISSYGNSVGVPTVTGQTNFDPSYDNNILVNAMAVGILKEGDPLALSQAKGVGNWVVYVGAKTGKDGVHGAAMASESFDEKSEAKKPNVQIGDPFFEKLLIESCLEVLKEKLVVAIQDMGAAGLTSSSFEMAAKGEIGLRMHLDKVPLRDSSMTPEEIMLSESQERMLLICEPANFAKLQSVYQRWGLDAVKIGEVVADQKITLVWKEEVITSIDPRLLVQNAPQYERSYYKWDYPNRLAHSPTEVKRILEDKSQDKTQDKSESTSEKSGDVYSWECLEAKVRSYLASESGAPRERIYRQYDQRVGGMTVRDAESDVSFQKLPLSHRGLATVVGCRPDWMKRDAAIGALDAVFYPTLQMSIKGARPVAVTDCLNFGNPENPKIMSEFVASVEAIRDACIGLNIPVVSGNVSFYNETMGKNITSTPATGLIGVRNNVNRIPSDYFSKAGSSVVMIGLADAFAFWNKKGNHWFGDLQVGRVVKLARFFQAIAEMPECLSSQMVSRGGIANSLINMCRSDLGFEMNQKTLQQLGVVEFFKEPLYQAIFEFESSASNAMLAIEKLKIAMKADSINLSMLELGSVVREKFEIGPMKFSVSEISQIKQNSQGRIFESLS